MSGSGGSADWIQITQLPTPDTVGLGGTSQIKWVSALAGTYYIERGGSGVPGTGAHRPCRYDVADGFRRNAGAAR